MTHILVIFLYVLFQVMLCALRAQIELGNFIGANMDYGEVIAHTLSPRLLSSVTHEAVAMHHQSLFNMDSQEAKQAFLNLIKSWPLHRATIFDVTVSCAFYYFVFTGGSKSNSLKSSSYKTNPYFSFFSQLGIQNPQLLHTIFS